MENIYPNAKKVNIEANLRELIAAWRTMAASKFLQTYNQGKAGGIQKCANDLEMLLEDEFPAARCSNCGTTLMYGFCFNSSCKTDEEVG